MRRVIVESPLAGNVEINLTYARACMLDCLRRGEAPFASHLLYTQCLDDRVPAKRELGIIAGFAWRDAAEATIVYTDLGVSPGMERGIADAQAKGRPIEYRTLPPDPLCICGHPRSQHRLHGTGMKCDVATCAHEGFEVKP